MITVLSILATIIFFILRELFHALHCAGIWSYVTLIVFIGLSVIGKISNWKLDQFNAWIDTWWETRPGATEDQETTPDSQTTLYDWGGQKPTQHRTEVTTPIG